MFFVKYSHTYPVIYIMQCEILCYFLILYTSSFSGLNYGTSMVLSELPKILAFIFDSLPLQGEKRRLNTKHLEILNRLTSYLLF